MRVIKWVVCVDMKMFYYCNLLIVFVQQLLYVGKTVGHPATITIIIDRVNILILATPNFVFYLTLENSRKGYKN